MRKILKSKVEDPHPFNADSDPAPHKMMGICEHWSIDTPGFHFEPTGHHL
jgi:hypothetical protein